MRRCNGAAASPRPETTDGTAMAQHYNARYAACRAMTHGDARRQVAAQTKSANSIFIPAGLSAGEWMGDGGRARGARRYHAAAAPARWQGQCTFAQPAKPCAGRRVARRGGRIKLRSHDRRRRGRRRIDALPRSRRRGCAAALPLVHHGLALALPVVPPGKAPLESRTPPSRSMPCLTARLFQVDNCVSILGRRPPAGAPRSSATPPLQDERTRPWQPPGGAPRAGERARAVGVRTRRR